VPIPCRLLRLLSHLTSAFVFGCQFPPREDMERKEDRVVLHPAQTSQYKLLTLKGRSVLRPANWSKPSVSVSDYQRVQNLLLTPLPRRDSQPAGGVPCDELTLLLPTLQPNDTHEIRPALRMAMVRTCTVGIAVGFDPASGPCVRPCLRQAG
jgi:hypothetical protein